MPEASRRRIIAIVIAIAAVVVVAVVGIRYWYEPTYKYVEVDDAQVTGNLARVAAPATGRVQELYVDVGQPVRADDRIASILVIVPQPGASDPTRALAQVKSPIDGLVASRRVNVGDNVTAGQPLISIVDLTDLWIIANVDEGRIPDIKPGQPVDVTIAGGALLSGTVTGIGAATTEAIDPPPSGSLTSDSTKKIPVRIAVDWGDAEAMPGMTADVIIYTR